MTIYPSNIDGLFAAYEFDEGGGLVLFDKTGNGRDIVLSGNPSFSVSSFGSCIDLEVSSSQCGWTHSVYPDISSKSTSISFFATMESWAGGTAVALGDKKGSGYYGWCVRIGSGELLVNNYISPTSAEYTHFAFDAGSNNTLNIPYHFCVTHNFATGAFNAYRNGQLFSTQSGSVLYSGSDGLAIGCYNRNDANLMHDGKIGRVRFYTKELTADEVLAQYSDYQYPFTSFLGNINSNISRPQRRFLIGSNDYSRFVTKWPTLKRSVDIEEIGTISISLFNGDGSFNGFYQNTYSVPNTIALQIGFDSEYATVYYGFIKKVSYAGDNCNITIKDRLYDFTQKRVGASSVPVVYSSSIPSNIAWDLCSCYGRLSSVASYSNPDINYQSFLDWAAVFSADSLVTSARFADHKVVNALRSLCDITDSGIWVGRDGKLHFKRFTSADSSYSAFQDNEIKELEIDIDDTRVVNKAFVDFEWSQASNYYARTVSAVNSISRNTFGLKEETYQSNIVWWVSSVDALNLANRQLTKYKDLPSYLDITLGLKGFNMDLGQTLRLINSFYGISSGTAWTVYNEEANLNDGFCKYNLRPIITTNNFRLDYSALDGSAQLL
jgi:hypothetical protein